MLKNRGRADRSKWCTEIVACFIPAAGIPKCRSAEVTPSYAQVRARPAIELLLRQAAALQAAKFSTDRPPSLLPFTFASALGRAVASSLNEVIGNTHVGKRESVGRRYVCPAKCPRLRSIFVWMNLILRENWTSGEGSAADMKV